MHSRFPRRVLNVSTQGFTLLELSVVLVIIGLLVGGVFAGATLVRSMELKSIQSEANEYRTGISSFRDRFQAYPGDMGNATLIWGEVGDTDNSKECPHDKGSGTETCNGNNDQRIAPLLGNLGNGTQPKESFRGWEHMQNAGLTKTKVSGMPGPAGDRDAIVGGNIPRSQFNKAAGWSLFNIPYDNSTANPCRQINSSGGFTRKMCSFNPADNIWVFSEISYNNILALGAQYQGYYALQPIIVPQDAKSLDDKFDDALPGSGTIIAAGNYAGDINDDPKCFEASDPHGGGYTTQLDYSINEREKACALIFTID